MEQASGTTRKIVPCAAEALGIRDHEYLARLLAAKMALARLSCPSLGSRQFPRFPVDDNREPGEDNGNNGHHE